MRATEVDSGLRHVSLPGGLSWGQWVPSLGLAMRVAPRGPPLTPPRVMFTFSTAPLTTAWTSGRCGFTGCITRTRANGEKAHACGLAGCGEAGLRVHAGSPPYGGEGASFPTFWERTPARGKRGSPGGELQAWPSSCDPSTGGDRGRAGADRETWALPVEAVGSVLASRAFLLQIQFWPRALLVHAF